MKFMPREVLPPAVRDQAPPMLELVNVCKRFGQAQARTVALSGVNLRIAKSEFVTLIGPSGCGKSTLFQMIAGLLPNDDGPLLFGGVPQRNSQLPVKVSFMPQPALLCPWLTLLDNAILAREVEVL